MKTPATKPSSGADTDPVDTAAKAPVDLTRKEQAALVAEMDKRTPEEREADEAEAARARDEAGAKLVQAPTSGDITAGEVVLTPGVQPVLEGSAEDWKSVVVVANAPERLPAHAGAKVIMAERRTQPDDKGQGAGQFDSEAVYSKNADAYVGHFELGEDGRPRNIFPDAGGKPVYMIGDNVKQFGLGGVSRQPGFLSVGPGSSVVAAVNLALQQGATNVRVSGMTDHDRAIVGPWLDKIAGEFESLDYGQEPDEQT